MSSTAGADSPLGYIAPFLEARRRGEVSDHIHFGYWEQPPAGPVDASGWAAAQARLTGRLIGMADLADGQRIADVACGIGGTLRAIAASVRPGLLVGLNIDARQLAFCPGPGEGVVLVQADAARLPLAPESFDRIFCIEAAFHFSQRSAFLAGAARALRPGGRLVLADILIDPASVPELHRAAIADGLRRGFGPWPAPWLTRGGLTALLAGAGLCPVEEEDATAATLPSYQVIAPGPPPPGSPESWPAAHIMRFLHQRRALRYWLVAARRT